MFFVLFFSLFSSEIVKILSKQDMEYWDAYKIVPILSFSMLFTMLRDVAYIGLNITKKTRIIALLIISAATLNIVLNLLFIPAWNYYGAAFATTVSQIYFLLPFFTLHKEVITFHMKLIRLFL